VTAHSILRLLPYCSASSGSIHYASQDLLKLNENSCGGIPW
jgi:microcin C transport system ATP-binding protein